MSVSININKTLGVAAGTSIIAPTDNFTNTYSISLDGIDAYVDCGTNGSINFDNTDTFSFFYG